MELALHYETNMWGMSFFPSDPPTISLGIEPRSPRGTLGVLTIVRGRNCGCHLPSDPTTVGKRGALLAVEFKQMNGSALCSQHLNIYC